MKNLICFIIVSLICTSCFYIPSNPYKEYKIIGDIVNEDTIYNKSYKNFNSKSYIVIKENKDTCILKETFIKNNKTNKTKIKYKEYKFILQQQ